MSDDEPWQSGIVEGPDMVETALTPGSNPHDHAYTSSTRAATRAR